MLQSALLDCPFLDLFPFSENGFVTPEVDVGQCDVVDALVISLMIVVINKGVEFIRQTASRAQAHANDTQPRVCRRAWHKLSVKNKWPIALSNVILRHFVSLSVSLKNTKTQSKTAKLLI